MPLASAYYVARLADAMGYQDHCPANKSFLRELDILAPWSGTHGAIALGKLKKCTKQYFQVCLMSGIYDLQMLHAVFDDRSVEHVHSQILNIPSFAQELTDHLELMAADSKVR